MEFDPNINTLILSIAGTLILFLLGIIAYFTKKRDRSIDENFKDQKKTNKSLQECINKLALTIIGLRGTIQAYGEAHDKLEKRFEDRVMACEKKFNNIKT